MCSRECSCSIDSDDAASGQDGEKIEIHVDGFLGGEMRCSIVYEEDMCC